MKDLSELHRIEKIEKRQEALRDYLRAERPELAEDDLLADFGAAGASAYAYACEGVVGPVTLPVGLVGPLRVLYHDYAEDEAGELVAGEAEQSAFFPIPMATHEGGLNASLNRGIKAANQGGGVRTWLLKASMTRGTCYVLETTEQAVLFSRWLESQVPKMKQWLEDKDNPLREASQKGVRLLSRFARLKGVQTHLISNTCHAVFEFTTGDACGQNMSTRNTFLLHQEYILPRFHSDTKIVPAHFFLEANTGGDKKVSHLYHIHGGHGRTVLASVILSEKIIREVLKGEVEDILKLREVGMEGSALSGMVGQAVNPANVIAAVFAATGQDIACVGTSSMAMLGVAECPAGLQATLRIPSLEVGTVGGGTDLPHQRRYLELMGCTGEGSASRFAQVLAAAALCLELSTGTAMAAAGSLSFYTAHLERGGMRRQQAPAQASPEVVAEFDRRKD